MSTDNRLIIPMAEPLEVEVPTLPHSGKTGILHQVRVFFGPSPVSLKGFTDTTEKLRSGLLSFVVGGVVHVLLLMLTLVLGNVSIIFPNPIIGGLVGLILTYVIDTIRRTQAGAEIVVTPTLPPPSLGDRNAAA